MGGGGRPINLLRLGCIMKHHRRRLRLGSLGRRGTGASNFIGYAAVMVGGGVTRSGDGDTLKIELLPPALGTCIGPT